jgi:hypothetical protein
MHDRQMPAAGEISSRPPRIFISYRREDAVAYAGRLYDALAERFGEANVFMDVDTIALGTDYTAAIDRALASCDAVVAVIGRSWLDARDAAGRRRLEDPGDVLRIEVERALSGPLLVVPTCVQGTRLPTEEQLPPSLAPLARRQGIELRDEAWRDDVARLVRRIEQAVRPASPGASAERPAAAGRWSRRRKAALVAGPIIAAAGVAAVVILTDGPTTAGDSRTTQAPEQQLLSAVPAVVRSSCASIDWGLESALASLSCSGAGVHAYYFLFASTALLDGWYVLGREAAGVAPDSGTCTPDAFLGEGVYRVGDDVAGRHFCYFEAGEATLVWTDERSLVGAKANVWDTTDASPAASLLTQWRCCFQPQK